MIKANEISRLLAARILPLARELFPAGRRDGTEWRIGSLAGEKGESLAIHIGTARPGVWRDFAGGDGGDALDLVAQALFQGDLRRAIAWSRAWLGLSEDAAPAVTRPAPPPARDDDSGRQRTACAKRLFDMAHPGIANSPIEAYLASRGIDIRELRKQPGALRYHPSLNCLEAGRPLPAMLAAVTMPGGGFVGLHRTWLQRTPNGWRKAPLQAPKKTLGSLTGGAIHLGSGLIL